MFSTTATCIHQSWVLQTELNCLSQSNTPRPRCAQSQNSMVQSKTKTMRAQADNVRGPSVAHWQADETHIPDSNLLLVTKVLGGEGSVPSPTAAIFSSITILRLNKQPKHLSVKHSLNSTAINGHWQGFKIKTAKPCRHTFIST